MHGTVEGGTRENAASIWQPLIEEATHLDRQGLHFDAEPRWRSALESSGNGANARRGLCLNLLHQGKRDDALSLLHREIQTDEGLRWIQHLVATCVSGADLHLAGELATSYAALRWGSRWYPRPHGAASGLFPERVPDTSLSAAKLNHDIEQFMHLQKIGVLGSEFDRTIASYTECARRLFEQGPEARMAMDEAAQTALGDVYNRIIHIAAAPRVGRALAGSWDPSAVEDAYLTQPPGLVVIDDFLSAEALAGLRRFCLESTVWSSIRHAYGRLGSQFQNGFSCPLLMQIAEELKAAFPRLIGERYPLRHLWGYKSPPVLPSDVTTHADFAAVNMNFWITPDEANLDPAGGGMVVYGVDAPMHWDFDTYNARLEDVIKPYIRREGVRAVHIPYRANRAVIFNSDLFHATAEVRFRPEYEFRRVNITYLFGDREADRDFKGLGRRDALHIAAREVSPWRSAALKGGRHRRR